MERRQATGNRQTRDLTVSRVFSGMSALVHRPSRIAQHSGRVAILALVALGFSGCGHLEPWVKPYERAALADYSIVYFATHGLVAGDVKGVAEPSLVLSIPKQPSEFDDGLLTSSEVAQLKLNADWVVLSACNTIAGDKPGAEALSGLARAFFYAGARALLVTHWSVDSAAATRLTKAVEARTTPTPITHTMTTMKMIGAAFKVRNPNATASCGCGTSFAVA